jgi:L-amino acid N-acyltransferase YncA
MTTPDITIRPATAADIPALCDLLNAVIRIGGTTAIETPLSHAAFDAYFLGGDLCLGCLVAEAAATGELLGFQALERHPELPADWADIATFARPDAKTSGIGTRLFAATQARARALGVIAINATIRGDNSGGLAFYSKMGFADYKVTPQVPLLDGRKVDRISKRYLLG